MKTIPDRRGLAHNVSIFCLIIGITLMLLLPTPILQLLFMLPILGVGPILLYMLSKKGSLPITQARQQKKTHWHYPALMQLAFIGIFALIDQVFQASAAHQGILPTLERINNAHLLTWIPATSGIAVMSYLLHTKQKRIGIGSVHAININEHAKDLTLLSNLFNSSSYPILLSLTITLVILKIFLLLPHTALGNLGQLISIFGALLPMLAIVLIPRIKQRLLKTTYKLSALFLWVIPTMIVWLAICYFSLQYLNLHALSAILKHGILISTNSLFFLKATTSLLLCAPTIYILSKYCSGMTIRALLMACLWLPVLTLLVVFTPAAHWLNTLNDYTAMKVLVSLFSLLCGLIGVFILTQRSIMQACIYATLYPEGKERFRGVNRILFTLLMLIAITICLLTSTEIWLYILAITLRFWPLIALNTALPFFGYRLLRKYQ